MRRRFEYTGMAVVLIVYLAMAVILLLERSGIHYQLKDYEVSLLPREMVFSSAYAEQEAECLVLANSGEASSMQAAEQFEQIFHDMKVGCDWVDVQTDDLPNLQNYQTVTVLLSDYSPLGEWVLELAEWVKSGGRALMALPPQKEASFMLIEQKMGIVESSYDYEQVDSIRFADGFLLGGSGDWSLSDSYESSMKIRLREDARVYAYDGDEKALALIWRCDYGHGRFVVSNLGYMAKELRGIYAACYSCLEDAFAYPVINGAAFYLDDFPSPVPAGEGTYIRKAYRMTVAEFYANVWWPDMLEMAEKYGIHYTGVIIENYDNKTDGRIVQEKDLTPFSYYGNMLLKAGGEIGIHGYNHQPLSLGNVSYGDQLPYHTWDSEQAMENALEEVMRFLQELYPDVEEYVYVPPSNVLSPEGRALLSRCYPRIHTIASTYFADGLAYAQEFAVGEDGIIEQPRTISGGILDDYARLTALSELNFHLVHNHFIHPDDVLDEDRGAALGWETLRSNLDDHMNWLYASCPMIRNLTGTELSGAVQRYCAVSVERKLSQGQMTLKLSHLADEAYLLVRLEDKQNPAVRGGRLTRLTDSLYLLQAQNSEITVSWSE